MGVERITRFSVSVPARLLRQFDDWVRSKGYESRSHAVADIIRHQIIEEEALTGKEEVAGTITLIYDHHHSSVQETVTEIQHEHFGHIISSVHVHLDEDNCLEVIILKGQPSQIQIIANKLLTAKGVKHGKLIVTTTGKNVPI